MKWMVWMVWIRFGDDVEGVYLFDTREDAIQDIGREINSNDSIPIGAFRLFCVEEWTLDAHTQVYIKGRSKDESSSVRTTIQGD